MGNATARNIYSKSIFRPLLAAIVSSSVIGIVGLSAIRISVGKSEELQQKLQSLSSHILVEEDACARMLAYCCSVISTNFEPRNRNFFIAKARQERQILARELAQLSPEEAQVITKCVASIDAMSVLQSGEKYNSGADRIRSYAAFLYDGLNFSNAKLLEIEHLRDDCAEQRDDLQKLQLVRDVTMWSLFLLPLAVTLYFLAVFIRLISSRFKALSDFNKAITSKKLDELSYLQMQLKQAYADVAALQEQKAMLIQMVAHDLRSPLMAVIASLEVFENIAGDFLPSEIFEHSADAQNDLNFAFELANKFLILEKIDANQLEPKFEATELKQLVDEIVGLNPLILKKDLIIENELFTEPVPCDRDLMRTVLTCWINWLVVQSAPSSRIALMGNLGENSLTMECTADSIVLGAYDQRHFFDWLLVNQGDPSEASVDRFVFNLTRKIVERQSGSVGVETPQDKDGITFWLKLPVNPGESKLSTPLRDAELESTQLDMPVVKPLVQTNLFLGGLVIALVPLVFQLGWLSYLNSAVSALSRLENRAIEQLETSILMEELGNKTFQANSYLAFYVSSGNEKYKKRAEEAALFLRSAANKEPLTTNKRLQSVGQFAREHARRIETNLVKSSSDIRESLNQTVKATDEQNRALEQPLFEELRQLQTTEDEERQISTAVVSTLTILFFANLLVGTLSVIFLRQKFRVKLNHLVRNAQRLPKDENLEPELDGDDELAMLDDYIHVTSRRLKMARSARNTTTSMIANALTSPLQNTEKQIEKLQHLASDVIANDNEKSIKMQRNLTAAATNCKRLNMLYSDLLAFAGDNPKLVLKTKRIEIDGLIENVLNDFRPLATTRSITLTTESSALKLDIDEHRIHQVISNLVSNALKFAPNSSEVDVRAKLLDEMGTRSAVIEVRDQGKGIDPQKLEAIFQKFQTDSAASPERGFGLGLTICKLIIHSHGGTITAKNNAPGMIFAVTLPMA
ncbi:MAG TPA: ATP-binding protein [Drouetiella sp.]